MKRCLLFSIMLTACTPVGTAGNDGERADTPNIVELGPLDDAPAVLRAHSSAALRVEGFGATALALEAPGAQLRVEGPLGDPEPPPGAGTIVDGAPDRLSVTLGAGVYRVIVETGADDVTLASSCSAGCARGSISAQALAARLIASGELQPLVDQLREKLALLAPDPTLRDQLDQQLGQLVAGSDLSWLARFPTVPLAALGQLRPALGLVPAKPPRPDQIVDGALGDLLGACDAPRALPDPISSLPGVAYGHFPNRALTDCQAARSDRLAQLLTSLAAQNGSRVTYAGQTLTTPEDLFAALVASGHTIVVRNERTYANFLSFAVDDGAAGLDAEWPVWIDTGVALADGTTVTVPMGHSHQAWRITGPDVDARVMFYLGISGAGFFAETDRRPAWTGMSVSDQDDSADQVLATVAAAARYLRRNRAERTTLAAGLPADGYGFLGVCNDSNATVEYLTRGTITAFPLLRAASLDAQASGDEGLDPVFRALPHDADQPPAHDDGLRRILAMTPHPLGSPLFPDDTLRAQLDEAAAELGP
jgi:hypothetical protein